MRDIEFRAWDLEEEKYISWDQLIHTRYNQEYIRDNENPNGPILSFMTDKHLQLEQFIGLVDKNGKEIYEGDILQISLIKGYVEFINLQYSLTFQDHGYVIKPSDYSEGLIIGNIHENPELLNDRA